MKSLVIKDAEIYFKNFRGKELPIYNPSGKRTFCVRIDGRKAKKLKKEGWAIKEVYINKSQTKKRWILPVTIYDTWADTKLNSQAIQHTRHLPRSSRSSKEFAIIGNEDLRLCKQLSHHSMGLLDIANITNSQMVIRGYEWDVNGKQGIKAFLRTGDFYISDTISVSKLIDFLEKDGL